MQSIELFKFIEYIILVSRRLSWHAMCYDTNYTDAWDTDVEALEASLMDWWLAFKCVMHGGQNAIKRGMDDLCDGELVKLVHIKIASLINGCCTKWNHHMQFVFLFTCFACAADLFFIICL